MQIRTINIPMYDYDVHMLYIEPTDKFEDIKPTLVQYGIDGQEDLDYHQSKLEGNARNGGTTYRNMHKKLFVVLLYPFDDYAMFVNIIDHEKRHIEDRLLADVRVDDIEAAGYLAGWLAMKLQVPPKYFAPIARRQFQTYILDNE